jgi:thioredoxin-dependent adenylylsulfate APS reductase
MMAEELLRWAIETYRDSLAITTSFQAEGMVILDMAARISPAVRVLTVDTGRLPEETHQMIETVRSRYGVRVEVIAPDPAEIEAMVAGHGPNLFYRGVAQRMLCCNVRKVRPLEKKLRDFRAWVVGLRRAQSEQRAGLQQMEEKDGLLKISPLFDWTDEQVEEYLALHDVPRHPLYAQGYASIGCAPCTRAIEPGEDSRAGRWWWEHDAVKECGIHFSANGRAERKLDVLLAEIASR